MLLPSHGQNFRMTNKPERLRYLDELKKKACFKITQFPGDDITGESWAVCNIDIQCKPRNGGKRRRIICPLAQGFEVGCWNTRHLNDATLRVSISGSYNKTVCLEGELINVLN